MQYPPRTAWIIRLERLPFLLLLILSEILNRPDPQIIVIAQDLTHVPEIQMEDVNRACCIRFMFCAVLSNTENNDCVIQLSA